MKGSFAKLSREEINLLPMRSWEGSVVLVQDDRTLSQALDALWRESVLGFDTETRPTFTKGVVNTPALLQLATPSVVYLILLKKIPFNADMATLLASPKIVKAGVAIHDDMKFLSEQFAFRPDGIADLAVMARERGVEAQGLRTLAASLLGIRISKGAQCSNWENEVLSLQQIRYAATDAWIGRALYFRLKGLPLKK